MISFDLYMMWDDVNFGLFTSQLMPFTIKNSPNSGHLATKLVLPIPRRNDPRTLIWAKSKIHVFFTFDCNFWQIHVWALWVQFQRVKVDKTKVSHLKWKTISKPNLKEKNPILKFNYTSDIIWPVKTFGGFGHRSTFQYIITYWICVSGPARASM